MGGKRQNLQLRLAFDEAETSEAPRATPRVEPPGTSRGPERAASRACTMEGVLEPENSETLGLPSLAPN